MKKVPTIPAPVYVTLALVKVVMLVVLLAGCAAAPDVRIDQAPAANLSQYRTFSFYEPLRSDGSTYSTIMGARLRQSTRDALERHGYVYDDTTPDLKVNFDLRIVDRHEVRSYPTSGGIFIRRAGLDDFDVSRYRQGTVSIDLVDTRQKALVWQGVADGRVDDRMIEDPGKAIDTVVRNLFTAFPLSRAN